MTEDEMAGWHHRLDGREFEQALGDGEGQGSLVCYSKWGCKESDTTQRLNNRQYFLSVAAVVAWGQIVYLPHRIMRIKLGNVNAFQALKRVLGSH